MNNINELLDILENTYPDAKCELKFTSPFELLVATILSTQCTDVVVNKVTNELYKKYNTPKDFINLSVEQIENEIKKCGLYKTKAKKIKETARILYNEFDSEVPNNMDDLTKLPGVGRKTANVVLSNAFGVDAMAVDTHVFRVSNRLGIVNEKTPEKTEFALMNAIPKNRWSHSHHLFIFHGRRTCKSRKPECSICTVKEFCKFYKNNLEELC